MVVNPVAEAGKGATKAHRRLSAFTVQGMGAVHTGGGGAMMGVEMATMGQAAPPNMGAVVNEVSECGGLCEVAGSRCVVSCCSL